MLILQPWCTMDWHTIARVILKKSLWGKIRVAGNTDQKQMENINRKQHGNDINTQNLDCKHLPQLLRCHSLTELPNVTVSLNVTHKLPAVLSGLLGQLAFVQGFWDSSTAFLRQNYTIDSTRFPFGMWSSLFRKIEFTVCEMIAGGDLLICPIPPA